MQVHQPGLPNSRSHLNLAGMMGMTRGEQQLNKAINNHKIPKDKGTTHGNGTALTADKDKIHGGAW